MDDHRPCYMSVLQSPELATKECVIHFKFDLLPPFPSFYPSVCLKISGKNKTACATREREREQSCFISVVLHAQHCFIVPNFSLINFLCIQFLLRINSPYLNVHEMVTDHILLVQILKWALFTPVNLYLQ